MPIVGAAEKAVFDVAKKDLFGSASFFDVKDEVVGRQVLDVKGYAPK